MAGELVSVETPSDEVIIRALQMFRWANRNSATKELIDRFKGKLSQNSEFLSMWAQYLLRTRTPVPPELLTGPILPRLVDSDPSSAVQLLVRSGGVPVETIFSVLRTSLNSKLNHGADLEDLAEVGRAFVLVDNQDYFEEAVRKKLGPARTTQILSHMRRRPDRPLFSTESP